jgi:thiosulfate reductase cytochrome b subunit
VFYTKGIFEGGRHPFEKTPGKRLNPLQQATYFMILHILMPLQGLTGILMWGVQKWPSAADLFGGLPFLAPLHSLVAWTFASFIVAHVYLTTTGATPLEAMRGMVTGYEDVEVHEHEEEVKKEGESK